MDVFSPNKIEGATFESATKYYRGQFKQARDNDWSPEDIIKLRNELEKTLPEAMRTSATKGKYSSGMEDKTTKIHWIATKLLARAYMIEAANYAKNGRFAEAEGSFMNASLQYQNLGDKRSLEKAKGVHKKIAGWAITEGTRFLEKGRYKEAENLYQWAVNLDRESLKRFNGNVSKYVRNAWVEHANRKAKRENYMAERGRKRKEFARVLNQRYSFF